MSWTATQAKAKFSEVLDKAETSGPQVVRRRKLEYLVMTRAESDRRFAARVASSTKPFVSGWDALGSPDMELFDVDFPRSKSKGRAVKF
jgi:hypothetical protein